jgi:DNA-binding GntR family transcriptional regulator
MNPASLPTAAERIAEKLRDKIISGELAGDTPLRQDQVAREFGASHVPVREAFHRLEALGLVVSLPRRGVRVAALNPASIRETVEMRAALEALALRNAAPNFESADFDRIEASQARCDAAASLEDWDAANREFHDALTASCGMPRLLAVLQQLQLAASRFMYSVGRARGWQPRSNHDHRLIIDALKGGDVDRAALLLARHIGTMERVGLPAVPAAPGKA